MVGRWLGRQRAVIAVNWWADCSRGFALGLTVGGPVLAWLGLI